jgi:prepilin-type N-terminal cleavage/methylation domain-containing protein
MRRCAENHGGLLGPGQRAFTLVEMLVSLAVLSIALGVVGYVFSATITATRKAAAYSEAHNLAQQLVNQLEEDLRNCDPANSLLVLVGRTQAAARTKDDLDARKFWRVLVGDPARVPANFDPEYTRPSGTLDPATYQYSDPRADILMFFSNRPTMSQAPHRDVTISASEQTFNDQCLQGVKFSPIQVVYGHAARGTAVYNATEKKFVLGDQPQHLQHIEQNQPGAGTGAESFSKLPVTAWHLSRRATILRDPLDYPSPLAPQLPRDIQFLSDAYENIVACTPYGDLFDPKMPGDAARLDWRCLLAQFSPKTEYTLASPEFWFNPYEFPEVSALGGGSGVGWNVDLLKCIRTLLYRSGPDAVPGQHFHHLATVVENPPPDLASNMGVHLLPGCAWFQVEFLMPEDPRNSLYYHDPEPSDSSKYSKRWDMPRWTEVEAGRTYVFIPDTAENRNHVAQLFASSATGAPDGRLRDFALVDPTGPDTVDNRVIRMWPYAIRITVRVFDRQGRLEQPIVRSIVHRFD